MPNFEKLKTINVIKKKTLVDFSILLLGATIIALAFNLFLLPNQIVIGFSGLSVIANKLWNIKPSIFLAISYVIITILSFFLLGKETTKKLIVGSILYPILVEVTSYLVPHLNFDGIETIVLVLCGSLIYGFGSGMIYKIGYSVGGSDVIIRFIFKTFKKPMGTAMLITNGAIVSLGFLAFGLSTVIYSLISIFISSLITDKVMIGISYSKSFYIITKYENEVKRYLTNTLSHGVTIISARGGYTGKVIKLIMCVIPTKEYVAIKEKVLSIDPDALILVSDTYEVLGNK